MLIRNTRKIDLATIDLAIEADEKMIAKVPILAIPDDAKQAWVHELRADQERLREIRPGYTDGRTEARHPRDTVVMLMAVSLGVRFMELLEAKKHANAASTPTGTANEVSRTPPEGDM